MIVLKQNRLNPLCCSCLNTEPCVHTPTHMHWGVGIRQPHVPSITFMCGLSPKWPFAYSPRDPLMHPLGGDKHKRTHHRSAHTHIHTHSQRLAKLDLQPATITCDWEPLKLVTNSILGLLIRHAWALGFLYVVIKGRVYGRPRALGWMIILTSSEPKATRCRGSGGTAGGGAPSKWVFDTERRCIGKWFLLVCSALSLTLGKNHTGRYAQRERVAITKLRKHTVVLFIFRVKCWQTEAKPTQPSSIICKERDKLYYPLRGGWQRLECHSKCNKSKNNNKNNLWK